jgi:DNA-binding transcriptional ArsR family regulator
MEISDPKAIRALAHPLRLDVLQLLGASGPATAAQCARALGTSQASCSFHLRQLAKYGFAEDAGPGSDRRERRWRAVPARLSIRGGAGGEAVQRQVRQIVAERDVQAILDYLGRPEGASPEWEHKAGIVTAMAVLSPDEAAALKEKWLELLAPYAVRADGRQPRSGQRPVRYFMSAIPLPEPEPGDSETGE